VTLEAVPASGQDVLSENADDDAKEGRAVTGDLLDHLPDQAARLTIKRAKSCRAREGDLVLVLDVLPGRRSRWEGR
jgi:hypothetical protein